MNIRKATESYDKWKAARTQIVKPDLEFKHEQMADAAFPFFRATFYRWVQLWEEICPDDAKAPSVLAVGDLHVENFGTWRDLEGRLIWGVNDFDEVYPMPYTIDLVRLSASVCLAIEEEHLSLLPEDACKAILKGYQDTLSEGGRPFVLAEKYPVLREWATARLRDPSLFWDKINAQPTLAGEVQQEVHDVLRRYLPEPGLSYRVVHRIAGLGSLGRQRFVALAQWRGGIIAREAKALVESAWIWQVSKPGGEIYYEKILTTAVRTVDPWVHLAGKWIVRRLSPDCRRIELESLPSDRNELKLLTAMGREVANIHLGSGAAAKTAIGEDLEKRERKWLLKAAQAMVVSVREDWRQWRKQGMKDEGLGMKDH